MDDATTTARWSATTDSAGQAAGAYVGLVVRRRRFWVVLTLVGVGYGMLLSFLGGSQDPADRLARGVMYGALATMGLMALFLGLVYWRTRRRCRRQLRPGVVLESSFGPDLLMLRGPWAEVRIQFAGLASVQRRGSWVFVKQRNSGITVLWPAELFPTTELARLQASISARTADLPG
jgi:hypothetical protein